MYRSHFDVATNTIKAIYGRNIEDFPSSIETSKRLWGVFDTFEYGAVTLHGGYQRRDTSSYDLLTATTEPFTTYSDLSLGAKYDPGKWFVMSEWLQHKSTSKRDAMYAGGGFHAGNFTPYVIYSQDSQSSPLPDAASPRYSTNSQRTVSLGSRWDFMEKADLKLQYDQVRLSANSNGDLANVPAGVTLYGTQFHVFSIVADFVF
jgi:predicted porin